MKQSFLFNEVKKSAGKNALKVRQFVWESGELWLKHYDIFVYYILHLIAIIMLNQPTWNNSNWYYSKSLKEEAYLPGRESVN